MATGFVAQRRGKRNERHIITREIKIGFPVENGATREISFRRRCSVNRSNVKNMKSIPPPTTHPLPPVRDEGDVYSFIYSQASVRLINTKDLTGFNEVRRRRLWFCMFCSRCKISRKIILDTQLDRSDIFTNDCL